MGARDLLVEMANAGIEVEAHGDNLLIRPSSRLTNDMRAALRTAKPVLLSLLMRPASLRGQWHAQGIQQRKCEECRFQLRAGNCGEPVAAGLTPSYGIVWPPNRYGMSCPSFEAESCSDAPERPYRLMDGEDRCHEAAWNEAEIELFLVRKQRFIRRGYDPQNAEDLAERLKLRDLDADDCEQRDDRHMCVECSQLANGRCESYKTAGLRSAELGKDLPVMLQRCPGYRPVTQPHSAPDSFYPREEIVGKPAFDGQSSYELSNPIRNEVGE
jgi:hypothetical protein